MTGERGGELARCRGDQLSALCNGSAKKRNPNHELKSTPRPTDFDRAFGDAKRQAGNVAGAVSDAAQDVYGQARDSAADVAGTANEAARNAMGSFEKAIRNTIETQPYTAAAIALGIGWLLGRLHRPL